jgi:2-polyprenyl-3-methyl-5-hydroxy-6-metoxy-1,4-benzoquinol methylase
MVSMPSTASDKTATARYKFSFAWESPYGHVVRLLERLDLKRGVVIDLGCGYATVADPLSEHGYEYVGVDIDAEAVSDLSSRGFEAHEVDLRRTDEVASRIEEIVGGREVAAVLLLDVLEHLPSPRPFLTTLRGLLDRVGRPPILMSVPNVTHSDVGAKLVFGHWDYTQTGLLDSTHLQFFTSARLQAEARACGLLQVDAHDFRRSMSDQRFPPDHPAVSPLSPVAQTMRMWRTAADSHGETVQFIRAFVACDSDDATSRSPAAASTDESFITVVMRTQGTRPIHLRDALTCLAAQTHDDFHVLIMVHSEEPEEAMRSTRAIVDEFDSTFAARLEVVHVAGGGRARPLNVALERLRSSHVAFLDDDDLVTANWIEVFARAAGEGAIVRSVAAVRHVAAPDEPHPIPCIVESPLEFRYEAEFDPVRHLWGNETPICTFAVPRSLIEAVGLRFDERLPVLEDWDFLMRCVAFAPVRDTREVTSIYQMWRSGESSASLHDVSVWQAIQRILQDRANQRPVVLPAGTANRLIEMCQRLSQHAAELEAARGEIAGARQETARQAQEVQRLGHEIGLVERKYLVITRSLRWRVLGPLARVVAAARGALRRA